MLEDYFNKEAISLMTFKEFEAVYSGSPLLAKFKVSCKDAFKQLGGKMYKSKKKTEGGE
jgi:hypothetical protein